MKSWRTNGVEGKRKVSFSIYQRTSRLSIRDGQECASLDPETLPDTLVGNIALVLVIFILFGVECSWGFLPLVCSRTFLVR